MPGTVLSASSSARTRLVLPPARGRTVLDGGWWPRSWDPAVELPGLVRALAERYGRIRHVMLNIHTWDSRIHRLAVGPDVVRIGWFDTLDPALLVATTGGDLQVDLLVVPPTTASATAERALAAAADPANLRPAPDLLAAGAPPSAPATATAAEPYAVWDDEGGGAPSARIQRDRAGSTTPASTGVPA